MNKLIDSKKCLICFKESGKHRNNTVYWHQDPQDPANVWCWCNRCGRAYNLYQYCDLAGIELKDFLAGNLTFDSTPANEVRKMDWPAWYVPLSDPRAQEGVDYIKSRGLNVEGDMYYDIDDKGIVFPYYFGEHFVGAQCRFLKERVKSDGDIQKIDTIPGTRLGLVFYNWNQGPFMTNVKGVIVCEGAFNALSIQQALNLAYGGVHRNPWRVIACSGSGASEHHTEALKELKEQGIKVVAASDTDEAGLKMLLKMKNADCLTHYALTMETGVDWNDKLKELGHDAFAKWFLGQVKSIDGELPQPS